MGEPGDVSGDRGGYWGLMRFLFDKSASSGSAANNRRLFGRVGATWSRKDSVVVCRCRVSRGSVHGFQSKFLPSSVLQVMARFRLCSSAIEFDQANNEPKESHFTTLSALRCIALVLPLAYKCEAIVKCIFPRGVNKLRNFHAEWTLDGWNNHIIQPA